MNRLITSIFLIKSNDNLFSIGRDAPNIAIHTEHRHTYTCIFMPVNVTHTLK